MNIRQLLYVILYLRVSTAEQAHDAYGLESQRRACEQFCADRGWVILEVFVDAGLSGWADVKRPGFRRMMQYLQDHRSVNLVFYDYSRFGRRVRPALNAFAKLDQLGVTSVAANNPGIDPHRCWANSHQR